MKPIGIILILAITLVLSWFGMSHPANPHLKGTELTWVKSSGDDLYDTASGDLEVGQFATYKTTGMFRVHYPGGVISSATSTVAYPDYIIYQDTKPKNMTEVKIIGTKFTDYFTDGVSIFEQPGDPTADALLGKTTDAPLPIPDPLKLIKK